MVTSNEAYRIEKDSMGPVRVPREAYFGAQTQRAIENFPISGLRFGRDMIYALGLIKFASARANFELGYLTRKIAMAIEKASREVMQGRWDDQFVVDIFQTGSGTSTNMNANEVIANRANEILGSQKGVYRPVHPNDHVNLGQSSNDVFPSAIHIAVVRVLEKELIPALRDLQQTLRKKERDFYPVLKIGRTHLQDALPVRLGQEFGGYARQVQLGLRRIEKTIESLHELPLGGTAVGTGMNTDRRFAAKALDMINRETGGNFRECLDHFEGQGAKDALVELSGVLKTVAVSLTKIANDIRWMGSGPRCGLGELHLPETQPGSSMMPGKVNPVIPESLIQVCAQVIGNDVAVTLGGMGGHFELNTMMPLIAYDILQSVHLLAKGTRNFSERCVAGLEADRERCEEMIEKSLALVTALAPRLGYDRAAQIAKEAYQLRKTIREVAEQKDLLPREELKTLLDPLSMISPKKDPGRGRGGPKAQVLQKGGTAHESRRT